MFLSTVTTLHAQNVNEETEKKSKFGIRAGYNSGSIDFQASSFLDSNLYVGFLFETKLSNKLYLQLETNYSRLVNFHLIEVPILFKYELFKNVKIYTGPQIDYAINNNNSFFDSDSKTFGISIGFGIEYTINNHWFLDARYAYGLTNQFSVDRIGTERFFRKKRNFNIGIGYKF